MAVGDHGIRVDAGGNRLAISRRGQLNRLVDTALYQRQCDQSELEVVDDAADPATGRPAAVSGSPVWGRASVLPSR